MAMPDPNYILQIDQTELNPQDPFSRRPTSAPSRSPSTARTTSPSSPSAARSGTRSAPAATARYGRRDFVWQSGGEGVLQYQKRNVFGFSLDFAEDVTKSNWSSEMTWIANNQYTDNDSFSGRNTSDTVNMTISVDRPTFINFLNPNRTFFFNSQVFFQYITNYKSGFVNNGPFNMLGTFTIQTGYFQDRLLPSVTFVYDLNSNSGAMLPQITYRFTENFSAVGGHELLLRALGDRGHRDRAARRGRHRGRSAWRTGTASRTGWRSCANATRPISASGTRSSGSGSGSDRVSARSLPESAQHHAQPDPSPRRSLSVPRSGSARRRSRRALLDPRLRRNHAAHVGCQLPHRERRPLAVDERAEPGGRGRPRARRHRPLRRALGLRPRAGPLRLHLQRLRDDPDLALLRRPREPRAAQLHHRPHQPVQRNAADPE